MLELQAVKSLVHRVCKISNACFLYELKQKITQEIEVISVNELHQAF